MRGADCQHLAAGSNTGTDARGRVLEDHAVLGVHAQLGGSREVGLGVRLALLDVVGGDKVGVGGDAGGREGLGRIVVRGASDDGPARIGARVELRVLVTNNCEESVADSRHRLRQVTIRCPRL